MLFSDFLTSNVIKPTITFAHLFPFFKDVPKSGKSQIIIVSVYLNWKNRLEQHLDWFLFRFFPLFFNANVNTANLFQMFCSFSQSVNLSWQKYCPRQALMDSLQCFHLLSKNSFNLLRTIFAKITFFQHHKFL